MMQLVWNNFRKWGSTWRNYVVVVSVLVFTYIRTDPIRTCAKSLHLSVTPYFFAFQMYDGITRMLFYFGLILLLCNAPFVDNQQMFVLQRTGRKKWFLGQILYIAMAVAVYFLIVATAGILLFIPQVSFSSGWGTVFTLCADHSMVSGTVVSKEMIESCTPVQACLIVFVLNWGIGMLLGLVVFYGNLFKNRVFGPAFAMGLVVFSSLISFIGWNQARYVSPVTWAGADVFFRTKDPVSPVYAAVFLITGCLLLGFLIMRKSKRYTIEALEEF